MSEQFTKWGKEFSLNCFLSSSLFPDPERWQATGSANFLFSEMPRWHAVQNSGPQPFQHQRPVLRKTIFPWTLGGCVRAGRFQDDSSMLCLLCILFLLLLHQLHLRSLGIRSRKVGDPWSRRIKDFVSGSAGFACSIVGHLNILKGLRWTVFFTIISLCCPASKYRDF